ncbi:gliding motility-associated C-terminal domain-containing protein [Chryseobacterium indoltheticum]
MSPNGDGVNDKWKIAGLENYTGSEIHVFDRKGISIQKNHQQKTIGMGW